LELRFPDISKETLELFLSWLFNRALFNHAKDVDLLSKVDVWDEQLACVRLWVFADKHFIPALQNHVMRRLHDLVHLGSSPPFHIIREAFENTPAELKNAKLHDECGSTMGLWTVTITTQNSDHLAIYPASRKISPDTISTN
jgi:hypothetical protein